MRLYGSNSCLNSQFNRNAVKYVVVIVDIGGNDGGGGSPHPICSKFDTYVRPS